MLTTTRFAQPLAMGTMATTQLTRSVVRGLAPHFSPPLREVENSPLDTAAVHCKANMRHNSLRMSWIVATGTDGRRTLHMRWK
jgi:hypothetical protein